MCILISHKESVENKISNEKLLLLVRHEATPFALLVNHSSKYREVWENSFSRARIDRKRKSAEVPEDTNYPHTT